MFSIRTLRARYEVTNDCLHKGTCWWMLMAKSHLAAEIMGRRFFMWLTHSLIEFSGLKAHFMVIQLKPLLRQIHGYSWDSFRHEIPPCLTHLTHTPLVRVPSSCASARTHTHAHVHTHVCTHTCARTHAHAHAHVHMHTHTVPPP